jgi:hypothetical protein
MHDRRSGPGLVTALAALFLAAAVAACASSADYEKAVAVWIGKHADALVAEWGPPQATYTYEDGRRALQYREREVRETAPVMGFDPYTMRDRVIHSGSVRELVCVTTFETDPGGIVRTVKFRGNACYPDS